MTILDYLLLGVFLVATIYTVCRLFIGWRYSSAGGTSADSTDGVNRTNLPDNQPWRASAGTPWHSQTRNK
jgi:hypothetical protein